MFKKIAVLMLMFSFCFGLYNCKSPAEPEGPGPIYKYRYNVEVIYTRVTVDQTDNQNYLKLVDLRYRLYDPALLVPPTPEFYDEGIIEMNKIGENKYRCYLPKVFVQNPRNPRKHSVNVSDYIAKSGSIAERIDIQGAYEWEITNADFGAFINSRLYFKMSKE